MAASHSSPESSASNLPFSIENILHGPSRKPMGGPQSAFRPVGKNVRLLPDFDELPESVCIEKPEATDRPCVSSSHAEKWLEERYPHLLSGKRLKSRFTDRQVTELERVFRSKPYIMGTDRKTLASQVGLSELQVKTWFQNKRQKYRRSTPLSEAQKQEEEEEEEHKQNDAASGSPEQQLGACGSNGH